LTVSTASSGQHLVLGGSVTASQNASIDSVSTQNFQCQSSVLPANCLENSPGGIGGFVFTGTTISPISVSNGQLIQVVVTISFS
jgi:hypothetical protein